MRKSLVLLRNEREAVCRCAPPRRSWWRGVAPRDFGMQCGGWSMEWLGFRGNEATEDHDLRRRARRVRGRRPPRGGRGAAARRRRARRPRRRRRGAVPREAAGDTHDLTLDAADAALIDALHDPAGARKLVCVLLCGRPLVLPPPLLAKLDALVVAWLPGTEGAGVADLLFGDAPFEGRLSFSWPRDNAQARREAREEDPLFRRGFGL